MKDTQLALIEGKALTSKDVMQAMDGVVQNLYQDGDIEKATHILDILSQIEDVSGLAKAKLLFGIKSWWDETGQSEIHNDTFSDYIESQTKTKKVTIDRYIVVQKHIEDLTLPKEFHARPIRELIPIAKMLEQGFEPSKNEWDELKLTDNIGDVGRVVRKIKKKDARKNTLQLVLERDGTIALWLKNKRYYIGYLSLDDVDENVQKAIARIVDSSGIRRK